MTRETERSGASTRALLYGGVLLLAVLAEYVPVLDADVPSWWSFEFTYWADEQAYTHTARNRHWFGVDDIGGDPGFDVLFPLTRWPTRISYALFGETTLTALRAPSIVWIFVGVCLWTWWMGKRYPGLAWLPALLVLTQAEGFSFWHGGLSYSWWPIVMLAVLAGLSSWRGAAVFAGGVCLGLAVGARVQNILCAPGIALFVVLDFCARPADRSEGIGPLMRAAIFGGGVAVALGGWYVLWWAPMHEVLREAGDLGPTSYRELLLPATPGDLLRNFLHSPLISALGASLGGWGALSFLGAVVTAVQYRQATRVERITACVYVAGLMALSGLTGRRPRYLLYLLPWSFVPAVVGARWLLTEAASWSRHRVAAVAGGVATVWAGLSAGSWIGSGAGWFGYASLAGVALIVVAALGRGRRVLAWVAVGGAILGGLIPIAVWVANPPRLAVAYTEVLDHELPHDARVVTNFTGGGFCLGTDRRVYFVRHIRGAPERGIAFFREIQPTHALYSREELAFYFPGEEFVPVATFPMPAHPDMFLVDLRGREDLWRKE